MEKNCIFLIPLYRQEKIEKRRDRKKIDLYRRYSERAPLRHGALQVEPYHTENNSKENNILLYYFHSKEGFDVCRQRLHFCQI